MAYPRYIDALDIPWRKNEAGEKFVKYSDVKNMRDANVDMIVKCRDCKCYNDGYCSNWEKDTKADNYCGCADSIYWD